MQKQPSTKSKLKTKGAKRNAKETKFAEQISEDKAVELLRTSFGRNDYGFRKVLEHSRAVQRTALGIAKKLARKGIFLDIPFIKSGSLLHDIGRSKCPPKTKSSIKHGIIGAKLLRQKGLFRHADLAERHIGAGITKTEAKKLGLPAKDYLPLSIEEKIIAHADNLVFGDKIKNFQMAYDCFEKELGKRYAQRLVKLKTQVENFS
ncbi:MAG: HD domain-containing protein [Nanoarchaeota archaeon]|nr:HD domain-containing protein [Nanoarchaeota archaeon]